MIEFLLIDLDDTILDFHKAEEIALSKTLSAFGIEPTESVCARYSQINKEHWERLERKELTRQQVVVGRFDQLFREVGVSCDSERCAAMYADHLSEGHYFLPGAEETLNILAKKYRLFLASNGNAAVQERRLKSAAISHYFEKIFISQQLGADKPSPDFFQAAFSQIPGFQKERAMIVGDSLTSDIQGGNNTGITTCWVNPKHLPRREDIRVDYEIDALHQLPALLEAL